MPWAGSSFVALSLGSDIGCSYWIAQERGIVNCKPPARGKAPGCGSKMLILAIEHLLGCLRRRCGRERWPHFDFNIAKETETVGVQEASTVCRTGGQHSLGTGSCHSLAGLTYSMDHCHRRLARTSKVGLEQGLQLGVVWQRRAMSGYS